MRVLVSGATGFLGGYLVKALLESGFQVIALKRANSRLDRFQGQKSGLVWYDVDQTPIKQIFEKESSIDHVIHAATCRGRHEESVTQIIKTNLIFSFELLFTCLEFQVPYFLNIDTAQPKEITPYALSKHQFVQWAIQAIEGSALRFVNIRSEILYAADINHESFLTYVIQQLIEEAPSLALTKGEQYRDWIHVEDAVEGILKIMQGAKSSKDSFQFFALGSGQARAIRDLVEFLKRETQSKTHLDFGAIDYHPFEPMQWIDELGPLRALGWTPKRPLEEGLRQMVAAFKSRRSVL